MSIIEQHPDIHHFKNGAREILVVGTAHISPASVELIEQVITEFQPDSVAIELCESRYQSLRDPERWKKTDLVSVIRNGKALVLLAQLMLAGFQKKLGDQLGIKPGAEMLKAAEVAERNGAIVVLADRDVRTTLRRTWAGVGVFTLCRLAYSMLSSSSGNDKIDAQEIERLKKSDALEGLLAEFSATLPGLKKTLIDERDTYLAAKINAAPGNKVVAALGAGHVSGVMAQLGKDLDISPLETIPPKSAWVKSLAWSIPGLIIAMFAYGFWSAGSQTGFEMAKMWFIVTGSFAAIGAAICLAHPLTILATFFAAPFTTINPVLAAGWVAGLVEAIVRKPQVADLESVMTDIGSVRGMWKNRVSRVLLLVAITNITASIGTLWGVKTLADILS